jgi:hypothetical protein
MTELDLGKIADNIAVVFHEMIVPDGTPVRLIYARFRAAFDQETFDAVVSVFLGHDNIVYRSGCFYPGVNFDELVGEEE